MGQMRFVIQALKNPSFEAADKSLTHLLFMRPWDQNFFFTSDITSNGRKFIEDQVTSQFFSKYKDSEIVEVDDEDCDESEWPQQIDS